MKLRPATAADIPAMIDVGRHAHAESRFGNFLYDEGKLREGLSGLISLQEKRGSHLCLLTESREGRLIGMFIGALEEYFFSRGQSANSVLLWVDPEYRGSAAALRMIRAFYVWGKKNGAAEVSVNVASGIRLAKTDRFLRRIGFVQTGGNYAMSLVAATADMEP